MSATPPPANDDVARTYCEVGVLFELHAATNDAVAIEMLCGMISRDDIDEDSIELLNHINAAAQSITGRIDSLRSAIARYSDNAAFTHRQRFPPMDSPGR